MEKKRCVSIDATKGFAIILVVMVHTCTNWNLLINWILSFIMPIFFMLSGYAEEIKYADEEAFRKTSILKYIKRKSCTIIWTYYVWAVITTIFSLLLSMYKGDNLSLVGRTFIARLIGIRIEENAIGSIWFLLTLYIAQIAAFVLKKIRKEWLIWFIGVAGTFCSVKWGSNLNLPFLLENSWIAIVFIYVGKLLQRSKHWKHMRKSKYSMVCYVLVVCLLLLGIGKNIDVELYGFTIGNPILFWTLSMGWSIVLLGIFEWISMYSKCKWLCWIGRESLIVMILHFYLREAMVGFVNVWGNFTKYESNLLFMILWCVLISIICCILSKIIKRKTPFLLSLSGL